MDEKGRGSLVISSLQIGGCAWLLNPALEVHNLDTMDIKCRRLVESFERVVIHHKPISFATVVADSRCMHGVLCWKGLSGNKS